MHDKDMIIYGCDYSCKKPAKITVNGNLIREVTFDASLNDNKYIIAPGLVDLQVNGYAGFDFNKTPLATDTVKNITEKLWNVGVTTFFPTVVTNSPENILESVGTIAEACSLWPEVAETVGGIHLEGPFISPEEGARGAHPAEYVIPPDWDLFCRWQEACNGMIKIITLSPEWPQSMNFIRKASQSGIIVAIGHTAAAPEKIREAVEAGATLSTHLGNGSHQMLHRHRNYIWEQLAADELAVTFISDGFHLPDSVMKVFIRVKRGKAIIVSDSTNFAGMPPGDYSSHIGGDVTLTSEGKLHLKGNPNVLAGSGLSLLHCVNTLIRKKLVSEEEAFNMAGLYPYELTKLPGTYGLKPGAVADLIILEKGENGYRVVKTIKSGRELPGTEADMITG